MEASTVENELDMPEISDEEALRQWYTNAESAFEAGSYSSELDGDEEGSYAEMMNEAGGEFSSYLRNDDKDEDGSDKTGEHESSTYRAEFYNEPHQLQLAIYAQDVVSLKDKNLILRKKVERLSKANSQYKEECKKQSYELKRIAEERDKALGEKYMLKSKFDHLESQLEKLKQELEDERVLREKVSEAKPHALEEKLLDAKYKLAKYAEKNDDLLFQMQETLRENNELKERSRTQRQQLHHLGSIMSRANLKVSSLDKLGRKTVKSPRSKGEGAKV